jgi:predicted AAA+ superfamily ATPase
MFRRLISPNLKRSFFLFGARGTGKSTLVENLNLGDPLLSINLLDPEQENLYSVAPERLLQQLESSRARYEWVVIDEVQRAPKLLDVAHFLIEKKKQKFILTGSSARKLKRGAANMLAGRAFVNHLFPLTHLELGEKFDLAEVLQWGSLPALFSLNDEEKKEYLKSYAFTYINEEIKSEQLVRNLVSFRKFLPVSAQMNGEELNYAKIAKDVSVDEKTVANYYSILEETWMGFFLESFHLSIRKSQREKSKFYWFDLGVKRILDQTLYSALVPKTAFYGDAFEHFIILEVFRLNEYFKKDYRLSFLKTNNGGEIDLILSKGRNHYAIEIKSTSRVDEKEAHKLEVLAKDIPDIKKIYYLSQDPVPQKIGKVECVPWALFFSILRDEL